MKSIPTHPPKTGKGTSGFEVQALILEIRSCDTAGGIAGGYFSERAGDWLVGKLVFLGVADPGVSAMLLMKQKP